MINYLIIILVSYFIGSISTSYIIAKRMMGVDIRTQGSGNAGSTNVLRTLGKKAGIFKIDENGNLPKNLERALACDSLATTCGALFGTSNLTTYVESTVGIDAGGRTGLTAVSAAFCFALSLFIAPIVACVPMAAIAPILMFVGVSMIESIIKIDWKDILVAIPAFFTIVMMTLSYSITTGIQFGFIFYILVSIASKKGKEVSPIIYVFTLLFIIDFIYKAIG